MTKMRQLSELITQNANSRNKTKRGFQPLFDVLAENRLPVTVKMERSQLLGRDNGLCTLQHHRVVTQLEYKQSGGATTFIPVNKEENVLAVMVDDAEKYETIEDLHVNKKAKKIQWFVSTNEFYLDNVLCHVGQMFTFAPTSLLRSFRRGRNRGIYVLFYPTMEKHFVPMETQGDFYKSECPSTCRTYKLSELIETKSFPCLLSFEVNNGRMRDGINTADPYFALNIRDMDILYASKKSCGSLQLHTFTAHAQTSVQVQSNRKPVDVLDINELDSIMKSVMLPLNSDLRYFYVIRSYKDLGVIRLLQEIIDELNDRENDFSLPNSNRTSDNTKKQSSLSKVKFSLRKSRNVPNKENVNLSSMNQPYGNHAQLSSQPQQIYHYENVSNNGASECNADIVDIDDSGYVIVPIGFYNSSPPDKDFEDGTYRSSENTGYDYQYRTSQKFNDHVYTYINPIISDTLKESNISDTLKDSSNSQYNFMSNFDDSFDVSNKNSCMKDVDVHNDVNGIYYKNIVDIEDDETEEGYYDYPHVGQCNLFQEQLKELSCEEVVDLLKVVKLKHHIDTFRRSRVDGNKLVSYSGSDFLNLNFTNFESVKIACFIEGWRPLKAPLSDNAWLTHMVTHWSTVDVSKYLLHLQMRSLQKFCISHDVDGYLLKKLVEGDTMDSLKDQHGITYRENDLEKLKEYVSQEEKPQFNFITR